MNEILKISKMLKKCSSAIVAIALIFSLVTLPIVNANLLQDTSPYDEEVMDGYEYLYSEALTEGDELSLVDEEDLSLAQAGDDELVTEEVAWEIVESEEVEEIMPLGRPPYLENVWPGNPGYSFIFIPACECGSFTFRFRAHGSGNLFSIYYRPANVTGPDYWRFLSTHDMTQAETNEPYLIHDGRFYLWNVFYTGNTFYFSYGFPIAPAVNDITVRKDWVNDTNHLGFRPDYITVHLRRLGQVDPVAVAQLNPGNGWSHTWVGFPVYSAPGVRIEYYVVEVDVPSWYQDIVVPEGSDFRITNTFDASIVGETSVTAIKHWVNDTNHLGFRPDYITVHLRRPGQEAPLAVQVLNPANGWTYTWTGLERYWAYNQAIQYYVVEVDVPAWYEKSIVPDGNVFTITNTFDASAVGETYVTAIKDWVNDTNHQGFRPDYITVHLRRADQEAPVAVQVLNPANNWRHTWTGLDLYLAPEEEIQYYVVEVDVPAWYIKTVEQEGNVFTITNTFDASIVGETTVAVIKDWDDVEDRFGFRPDYITVHLRRPGQAEPVAIQVLNPGNDWTHTWLELELYWAYGQEIEYYVVEVDVPDWYIKDIEQEGNVFTITNTLDPRYAATMDVHVTKEWCDEDDRFGFRPDSVRVWLVVDGESVYDAVLTPDEYGNWDEVYTWTDLAVWRLGEEGVPVEIVYTVEEYPVPAGYTVNVELCEVTPNFFIVTNTLYDRWRSVTYIEVTKLWEGDEDHLGFRPDSVTVKLRRADRPGLDEYVYRAVLSVDNDWTYAWTNLPVYKGVETEIYYYVIEVDIPVGYDPVVTGNAEEGFVVTNIFDLTAVGDGAIQVTKVWVGDERHQDLRPDTITVELRRQDRPGEVVSRILLEADEDGYWVHVWTGVPVYKAEGVAIVYYVAEINPPARYTPSYSGDQYEGFVITNTFQPDPDRRPEAPRTGDLLSATSLAATLLILTMLLTGTFLVKRRRENE